MDWHRSKKAVGYKKNRKDFVTSCRLRDGCDAFIASRRATSLCTTKQEASASRSFPTRSSLRVDIALHQGPCLKFDVAMCTRTSENQDLSQSNSWAVRQRVGVRIRWCHWQMAKKRPKEIDRLVRHSALQFNVLSHGLYCLKILFLWYTYIRRAKFVHAKAFAILGLFAIWKHSSLRAN
jgi:hypothetical protein